MADPILGATVQVLMEKALSVAADRIGLLRGFKKDLEKLKRSAEMIQAVLADAEVKQTGSQPVRLWLNRLKNVAFDADIVLDELNYEFLRRKVKSRNQLQGKVCSFFYFSKDDISFRWRMASKVRDINNKLNNINQEAQELRLVQMETQPLAPFKAVLPSRETDSSAAPDVVGRGNDESKIVEILLSPSEKVVAVLPIVGMGGLGKTTLAKSVFNNQQIHDHFNQKIWVCVSEKFEVMALFKLILESFIRKGVELAGRENVVQEIRKELKGKRYLLVLDDVWNEDQVSWDDFFNTLVEISTGHGSKCLVTTRLHKVASIVSPHHPPYMLGVLTDDECFSIIKQKVAQSEEMPEELIRIKERVIKICDGLPLAANVIGGVLLSQRKEKWRMIVESWLWNFTEGPEKRIMQTLKLSFDYLPSPSIKKCFAYCSLFSKDERIDRDLLIELWMAEGFLHTNRPHTMEEIGGEYHDTLVQSSLLEKVEDYYAMHDLVHDLAQSLSKLQSLDSENDAIKNCAFQVRYLALDTSAEIMSLNDTSALILKSSSISDEMLLKFKHLHTLNLSVADITELPSSIGKLKHLRFLAISNSKIKSLPESVCKLYNLQTLRMRHCYTLVAFPQGMNNLISLRHLHYYRGIAEFKMPLEMGRLTSLQTLEFFNVGEELGRHIDELGPLKFLKGKLEIRNLELVKGKEGAEGAFLSGKQNLRKLKFCWSSSANREDAEINDDESVLYGLEPHENLEVLRIQNFKGSRFPDWLQNLSKLVKLELNGCDKVTSLFDLHVDPTGTANSHFTSLKEFRVIACEGLVSMAKEPLEGCTSLSFLEVYDCPNLISFPLDLQQTPSLSIVSLAKCPKLFTDKNGMPRGFGHLTSLESLYIGPFSTDDCSMELFDWSGLKSCSSTLRFLALYGSPHMESVLPAEFRHFTDLKSLYFFDLGSIETLPEWLGNLASLEELWLWRCEKLRYLPSMPALRRLTKLRQLWIRQCPLLRETCGSNSGPDSEWSKKISQLPNLEIQLLSS